jgi:hypothetical protein
VYPKEAFSCRHPRRDGDDVGYIELTGFPLNSFTLPGFQEAVARGDPQAALRIAAQDYYATFREDRAATCGTGYVVETITPTEVTVSGGSGLHYGFTGAFGGTVAERNLGYSTVRNGRLYVPSAPSVAPAPASRRKGSTGSPNASQSSPHCSNAWWPRPGSPRSDPGNRRNNQGRPESGSGGTRWTTTSGGRRRSPS